MGTNRGLKDVKLPNTTLPHFSRALESSLLVNWNEKGCERPKTMKLQFIAMSCEGMTVRGRVLKIGLPCNILGGEDGREYGP
jgi:hypothetical protein